MRLRMPEEFALRLAGLLQPELALLMLCSYKVASHASVNDAGRSCTWQQTFFTQPPESKLAEKENDLANSTSDPSTTVL